jgi:hypothetical protein
MESIDNINKSDDSVLLQFDHLGAEVKFSRENAIKPVFFIPGMDPDKSLTVFNYEPFVNTVFPYCNMYMDFVGTEDSVNKMVLAIMDQANALFHTNINIIFNDGIIACLKLFVDPENLPNVMEKYNFFMSGIPADFAMLEVFGNMKKQYKNENHNNEYIEDLVTLFTKSKAVISKRLADAIYRFLNDVMTSGYLNFEKGLKTLSIFKNDEGPDESTFSMCMMYFLGMANEDLNKIMELYEFIIVNAFYRFSDLLNYAAKNNIDLKPPRTGSPNESGSFIF